MAEVDNDKVINLFGVLKMGKQKKVKAFLVIFFVCSSLFARQISFQVVQHDDSSKEVTEQSLVIEDQLLNTFFEKGYIVTNSPSVASASESQDEKFWKTGLGEAFDGYSDYFVQIKVWYEPRVGTLRDVANIQKINWSLTEAKTGIKLVEHSLDDIKPINKKTDMNLITSSLVFDIDKALNANKA